MFLDKLFSDPRFALGAGLLGTGDIIGGLNNLMLQGLLGPTGKNAQNQNQRPDNPFNRLMTNPRFNAGMAMLSHDPYWLLMSNLYNRR